MGAMQQLKDHHAKFRHLLAEVLDFTRRNSTEAGLMKAQEAAYWAWRQSCGFFAAPELETLLAKLSAQLPQDPLPSKPESAFRQVLTVMTSIHALGGHSRFAWRWMALDTASRHTLVLTQQGDAPLPAQLSAMVDRGEVHLVLLQQDSLSERALALRAQVALADYVVLLIHPHDVLANAAIAAMPAPPPVLFQDHAAHTFWLGSTISRLVLSQSGALLASRRGIPTPNIGWTPIPIDFERVNDATQRDMRRELDIPPDVPLLMTCGSAYKYLPIDDISLPTLLAPLLAAEPEAHLLVVGTSANPTWAPLLQEFGSRVRLVGFMDEAALSASYHACDVYLDSTPFTSPTAMFEAAACGRPIVRFAAPAWRDSEFSLDIETMPASLYIWSDAEAYRADIRRLLHDEAYRNWRSDFGQQAVKLIHADETFVRAVEAAYQRAAGLPLITLSPKVGEFRYDKLDDLLGQLANNMSVQEAFDSAARQSLVSIVQAQESPIAKSRLLLDWLTRRIPSASQSELIDAYLAQHGQPTLLIVVLDLENNRDTTGRTIASLTKQLYSNVQLLIVGAGKPGRKPSQGTIHFANVDPADWVTGVNQTLATLTFDWLLVVQSGTEFTPAGLLLTTVHSLETPSCQILYADEFIRTGSDQLTPWFRPSFNLDLLLSYPKYLDQHILIRRDAFFALDGFDPTRQAAASYDLLLRAVIAYGLGALGHVAEVMLIADAQYEEAATKAAQFAAIESHLQARDYQAQVLPGRTPESWRIDYRHPTQPLVTIIIPTRDQLPMLRRCVESLLEKTTYPNYELLIVDNQSSEPNAVAYLNGLIELQHAAIRVLRYPHPFNFAAMNNAAVADARGDYVLLLNNDTAIAQRDWLEQLMNHGQRPEVGAVGAKLLFPNTTVQHAGVVLGLRGPADHPGIGQPADAIGYMQRLAVDQNFSAVTAACMLVRKAIYQAVGGMDEGDFKVSYNDVDLCLKISQAGYLLVWTPHAVLLHEGSISQTRVDKAALEAKKKRFTEEQYALYRKWLPRIAEDPAYNRNLSLVGNGYEVAAPSLVNWQPLPWRPLPVVLCHPGDAHGCGQYRVLQPFAALEAAQKVSGGISWEIFNPPYLGRLDPDVIIFQRQTTQEQQRFIEQIKATSRAFRIFELDDYLPNVPLKSVHRSNIPKDVLKQLRKSISMMDRFVVSTPALANALNDLHQDIHVVRNCLPVPWWGEVKALREQGSKPRVGWAGGVSHTGDLDLIIDVVKHFVDQVEWVFFGMCPDALKPYVHEFHPGVPIEQYPAKLASLNLDLALAPLEHNLFNECKSNLRLLEYGACGFPVICTDLVPYQGALPVTRVRNRFKEWIDAIEMHIQDRAASQRQGDALREMVRSEWMLDGANLALWQQAWHVA